MKNFLIAILITGFVLLMAWYKNNNSFLKYRLENKTYKLIVVYNQSEWSKGLMYYKNKKELKGADGMIFIFPEKEYRTFWNKNTYLDLDIYWLDNDSVVGKDYLPNILKTKKIFTVDSGKEVNKVVEIVR
jgi:uncharacterized membrane protein (UPF0127 family)